MWTAAGLDGADSVRFEGLVANQELAVLFGKNIVSYRGQPQPLPQPPAQRQHQRGFAAANRPANADSESALRKIAPERPLPLVEMAGAGEFRVRVGIIVRMIETHVWKRREYNRS